jgi:His/Glu/Gln/Arg/opine family amino acid ABC transporter permease subunit
MKFDWTVVWVHRWDFMAGVGVTITLAVVTMLIAIPLGIVVMLLRQSHFRPVSLLATAYVEIFRNLPLLLIVFWAYYVLPRYIGVSMSAIATGIVALTLNVGAYNAENFRAGVNSIRRGQTEAGLSMGMTRWQVQRYVVLPQAIRRIVPVLASTWVSLFKGTALVSAIGVADLYHVAADLRGATFRVVEVLSAMTLIYWILAYPQSKIVDWLNRKYGYSE